VKKIEFYKGTWIEDPSWTCVLDDGKAVHLGAFFRITNLLEAKCFGDDDPRADTPWLVESVIYPCPEELSDRFKEDMAVRLDGSVDRLIWYMATYTSGVPFNVLAIDFSNKKQKKSITFELSSGVKMPLFKTLPDAMSFIDSKIKILPAVFSIVGFFLDAPVNKRRKSGWEYIKNMVR